MRKFFYVSFIFLCLLCFRIQGNTQNISGLNQGGYAGITALEIQPAAIARTFYKTDFILGGAEVNFANNIVGIKGKVFFNGEIFKQPAPGNFQEKYMKSYIGSQTDNSLNLSLSAQSFSGLFSIDNKSSLAFTFKFRFQANVDNFTSQLATIIYNANQLPEYYKVELKNDRAAINTMLWGEFGLAYARQIYDGKEFSVSAGARLKLSPGVDGGYIYAKNLNYQFASRDQITLIGSEFGYGHSNNYELNINTVKVNRFTTAPALGGDIGFTFTRRLSELLKVRPEEYKFQLGISVLDMGRIRFQRADLSRNFKAEIRNWNLSQLKLNTYHEPIKALDDTFKKKFVSIPVDNNFNMSLPTAVNLQLDYRLTSKFYVGGITNIPLKIGTAEHRLNALRYYMVSPRFEMKWFAVALPLSINEYDDKQIGLSLKLGPVWLGSTNILSNMVNTYAQSFNLQAVVKIPIFKAKESKKKKDKDKDGVVDELDACPDDYGSSKTEGCPDLDGDGVPDIKDLCFSIQGPIALGGCPDSDGDLVPDIADSCPTQKGEISTMGCPDVDGDGIADKFDKCPETPGSVSGKGCVDTDGDGVADNKDHCPLVAGIDSLNGCPDSDGDGISDEVDPCPQERGSIELNGCPDSDRDGIADKFDACPDIQGLKINNGCPSSKKEVENKDPLQIGTAPLNNKESVIYDSIFLGNKWIKRKNNAIKRSIKIKSTKGIDSNTVPINKKNLNGKSSLKNNQVLIPNRDSDYDGIPDWKDKCKFTPGLPSREGCPVGSPSTVEALEKLNANIEFVDSYPDLKESSQTLLLNFIAEFKKEVKVSLLIDARGDSTKNPDLIKERMFAIKKIIVLEDISNTQVKAEYSGEGKKSIKVNPLPLEGKFIIRLLKK